ncbi:hypothetical protein AVEN_96098-1 [Araneus ventricosus]|uniref:Uncharacterized protein n=1 Tax=Araneus ventricosus TaxID=182803 RepID=A0A4Y2B4F3_ARAVE|nr:hypothetical protein AVEN_96098-1 [Araneus ventricosus]
MGEKKISRRYPHTNKLPRPYSYPNYAKAVDRSRTWPRDIYHLVSTTPLIKFVDDGYGMPPKPPLWIYQNLYFSSPLIPGGCVHIFFSIFSNFSHNSAHPSAPGLTKCAEVNTRVRYEHVAGPIPPWGENLILGPNK